MDSNVKSYANREYSPRKHGGCTESEVKIIKLLANKGNLFYLTCRIFVASTEV